MYAFSGFGITAGYHRLWAHRSYTASIPVQCVLAIAGACASQGSILWWSKFHRLHHNKSDTEDDPYGPQKGFLYSHLLWIFENRKIDALKKVDSKDLKANPIVMFQHRFYPLFSLVFSIGIPLVLYNYWNQSLWNCFFYPIALRVVLVWHSTWFVNSLAHSLGEQPYGNSGTSKDHFVTALLTLGEGYHNYHHEFPYDYRNAIQWYQYDPTKWLIEILYLMGLTSQLKTREALYKAIPCVESMEDITIEEYLEKTKKENKQWIAFQGDIYDVTGLLDVHPGGSSYIKMVIGKSEKFVTDHFNKFNNHTNNAFDLLKKCRLCGIKTE
jgi:stearoyl-CoA desaturase (delta-9 desaturase)